MAPHKEEPSSFTSTPNSSFSMLNTTTFHNGSTIIMAPEMSLPDGVYIPTPTFYNKLTGDIDAKATTQHNVRLAKAGATGLVPGGSNGELVHLMREERMLNVSLARNSLDGAGFEHIPVIAGCSAQSTRETIRNCTDAKESGAQYALILSPSYYAGLLKPGMRSIIEFYTQVADQSPIPIIIYNYPGAVSGLDLNSDVIIELSKHPKIVGVKLTCGNIGKMTRIVDATEGTGFVVLGGSADFTRPSLQCGGNGILAGLANIAPRSCAKLIALEKEGRFKEAKKLQAIVANGDWAVIKTGPIGTKDILERHFGYGGYAREPLPKADEAMAASVDKDIAELIKYERELEANAA